jgi:hypothetical protein
MFKDENPVVLTQDNSRFLEGTVSVSLVNLGKRPAKSVHAQYEKFASGHVLPSWRLLNWVQQDGTKTTKAYLGYQEPAKLELFKFKDFVDESNPKKRIIDFDVYGEIVHFEYDVTSTEATRKITKFHIGIYGDDDLEEHITAYVFAKDHYIGVGLGPIRLLRASFT